MLKGLFELFFCWFLLNVFCFLIMTGDFWQCVGHCILKIICKNNLKFSMIVSSSKKDFNLSLPDTWGDISLDELKQVQSQGFLNHPHGIKAEGNCLQGEVYSWFTLPEAVTLWDLSLKRRWVTRIPTSGRLQVFPFAFSPRICQRYSPVLQLCL